MTVDDARRDEAVAALEDVLTRYRDVFGPDPEDCGPGERPVEPLMLSEWVLAAGWVDQAGDTWSGWFSPPHMAGWHASGLLHDALHA